MSGWLITNHSASITLSSVTKRRKINRKRQKFKTPWCSIKGMHKKDWLYSRNFDIHLIQSLFRLIFLILKKGKEANCDIKEPFTHKKKKFWIPLQHIFIVFYINVLSTELFDYWPMSRIFQIKNVFCENSP